MTFLTITPEAWYLAGISIVAVYCILEILVLILNAFSYITRKLSNGSHRNGSRRKANKHSLAPGMHTDEVETEEELAVIATAIYLYFNSKHDEESGVLTIDNSQPSNWHAVLNPRL